MHSASACRMGGTLPASVSGGSGARKNELGSHLLGSGQPTPAVERCTACLLLDVDPVDMVRGKNPRQAFLLDNRFVIWLTPLWVPKRGSAGAILAFY
jgi:hypothetical protein